MPPGLHGEDVPYYFPESFVFLSFLFSPDSQFNLRSANDLSDISTFGTSFSESFLSFVISLDPNVKWNSSNITPTWGLWMDVTEMLFNVTEAGTPDIHSVTTSS